MKKLDVTKLSPEEKAQLLEVLAEEQRAEDKRKRDAKKNYEQQRDKTIRTVFKKLERLSDQILKTKQNCFDSFDDVLNKKRELFSIDDERWNFQQSHTFTTEDGKFTVIIGHNVIDSWDDTVEQGIEYVNKFLTKLAVDKESAVLVDMIRDLLKPNKDGQVKASRVLDLTKRADEIGDKDLSEGVRIIRDAYKPAKTSTYLKAKYKDELGRDIYLPLSVSAV
jgi:hypothetical protein